MRQPLARRRARYLQIGVPAAVIGSLTGPLAVVPAQADTTVPIERMQGPGRIVPATTTPASYVVQPGDTVSSIARQHGLRTVDVLAWNGLTWRSVIYPGQSLTLSGTTAAPAAPVSVTTAPAGASHVVVSGDTVYGIAQKYGTTVDAVLAANGLTHSSIIHPGQTLAVSGAPAPAAAPPATPPPPAATQTHVVAAGDTLFGIAQKYGTTTAALFALNGLSTGSIIYPGQSIAVAGAPAPAPAATPVPAQAASSQSAAALDAEQVGNAALIIRIGRELGVSDRAIAIGLATAMVESSMRNLSWGDRDSLGLFQQRPSTGWGSAEQILDADRSTRVFFGGAGDPNGQSTRGLLDIPGWESMRFTDAAQAVQISAYPERYGLWETQAYQWLAQYG
ncbi:muramidase family protein [Microbacterium hydrocarbonoxydans]|uniref:muramidase family protein n=1 Tax=Microbacterium hydrocarbonoxydans TaxID=273678 RepID=UPI00203D5141|nr:LysM peptidoglycan-binding domain-containing protein [Microbacterium hydrocarbonoxydans]MCM3781055.1 LysM peptidoglycan-binding domain-containing protein [Microbacterium hydrocarbonoxydans]